MKPPATSENLSFSLSLVLVSATHPATCSLDEAAALAGVHPALLRHYCRLGFLGEALASPAAEPVFDDNALFELRRFEHYRRHHGLSRQTARHLCALWRELERLQAELRFLRRP